jgi:hypothetical protein
LRIEWGYRLYSIKPVVVLAVALIILFASFLPNIYAGGPRNDWFTDYNNIPGAPQCWQDGYDDGLDHPFNQDRHKECIFELDPNPYDRGKPYYEAFIIGCKDAGNTEEICETFTDE